MYNGLSWNRIGLRYRSNQSSTIAQVDGHDLMWADIKIPNPKETSLFSSLMPPTLLSAINRWGFTPRVDYEVSIPLPHSPPISPLSSLLLSVFRECHGHFCPLSLPWCTSILLLNSCCVVFFYLYTSGSSSEEVVCFRIYFWWSLCRCYSSILLLLKRGHERICCRGGWQ
jgi:hypothetical protein